MKELSSDRTFLLGDRKEYFKLTCGIDEYETFFN